MSGLKISRQGDDWWQAYGDKCGPGVAVRIQKNSMGRYEVTGLTINRWVEQGPISAGELRELPLSAIESAITYRIWREERQ